MRTKIYFRTIFIFALVFLLTNSCVHSNDWETPPINCTNRFNASTITMAEFVATASVANTIKIPVDGNEIIFDAYVVSSDENGNFYKTISFQDKPENPSVGLQMEVDRVANFADFPVGSHVRIKANGLILGTDRGVVKLGTGDPIYAIGRIPNALFTKYIAGVCNGESLEIAEIVPAEVANLAETQNPKFINTLVKIKNVQFNGSELGKTYLDYIAGAGTDSDRILNDVFGNKGTLRNSGFFTNGKVPIPETSGEITVLVSKFGNNYQLLIRSLNDIQFDNPRKISEIENFDSFAKNTVDFTPKYQNISLTGNKKWAVQTFGTNNYIQISGLNGGLVKTQFAIPVDFKNAKNVTFRSNAGYYNGEVLKVYWSADFDPANPKVATLNDITSQFDISQGKIPAGTGANYETNFRASGVGLLPITVSGKGFIIFEYNSNSTNNFGVSTVMQLDDINIF